MLQCQVRLVEVVTKHKKTTKHSYKYLSLMNAGYFIVSLKILITFTYLLHIIMCASMFNIQIYTDTNISVIVLLSIRVNKTCWDATDHSSQLVS